MDNLLELLPLLNSKVVVFALLNAKIDMVMNISRCTLHVKKKMNALHHYRFISIYKRFTITFERKKQGCPNIICSLFLMMLTLRWMASTPHNEKIVEIVKNHLFSWERVYSVPSQVYLLHAFNCTYSWHCIGTNSLWWPETATFKSTLLWGIWYVS